MRPSPAAVVFLVGCAAAAPPARTERAPADDHRCGICGAFVAESSRETFAGVDYHASCWQGTARCEGCGLPPIGARAPGSRLRDGRLTCAACARAAVVEEKGARDALAEARGLLHSRLGLDLGKIEVPLRLVSKDVLASQAGDAWTPAIKALTVVREEPKNGERGKRAYRIVALYGLPRPALVASLGHELFHVLQHEANAADRSAAFREGSASWVQTVLLRALGEETTARLLECETDPVYGEGLRRFGRLVAARGEKDAVSLGLQSLAFPDGF